MEPFIIDVLPKYTLKIIDIKGNITTRDYSKLIDIARYLGCSISKVSMNKSKIFKVKADENQYHIVKNYNIKYTDSFGNSQIFERNSDLIKNVYGMNTSKLYKYLFEKYKNPSEFVSSNLESESEDDLSGNNFSKSIVFTEMEVDFSFLP